MRPSQIKELYMSGFEDEAIQQLLGDKNLVCIIARWEHEKTHPQPVEVQQEVRRYDEAEDVDCDNNRNVRFQ